MGRRSVLGKVLLVPLLVLAALGLSAAGRATSAGAAPAGTADLAINATPAGSIVTYTVTNNGPLTAGSFTITIQGFSAASPGLEGVSPGTFCPVLASGNGTATNTFVCANLPAGYSTTVSVDVPIWTVVAATVTLNGQIDPNPTNNAALVTILSRPLPISPAAFSAVAGTPATVTLGTFNNTDGICQAGEAYLVVIDWGDGTITPGTTGTGCNIPLAITGTHNYAQPGVYAVSVGVTSANVLDNATFIFSTTAAVAGQTPYTNHPYYAPAPSGPPPYSGMGFDPRCVYGCPPNGLP